MVVPSGRDGVPAAGRAAHAHGLCGEHGPGDPVPAGPGRALRPASPGRQPGRDRPDACRDRAPLDLDQARPVHGGGDMDRTRAGRVGPAVLDQPRAVGRGRGAGAARAGERRPDRQGRSPLRRRDRPDGTSPGHRARRDRGSRRRLRGEWLFRPAPAQHRGAGAGDALQSRDVPLEPGRGCHRRRRDAGGGEGTGGACGIIGAAHHHVSRACTPAASMPSAT